MWGFVLTRKKDAWEKPFHFRDDDDVIMVLVVADTYQTLPEPDAGRSAPETHLRRGRIYTHETVVHIPQPQQWLPGSFL